MNRAVRNSACKIAFLVLPLIITGCSTPGEGTFASCVATATAVGTGVGAVGGPAGAMAGAGVGSLGALVACQSPEEETKTLEPTIMSAPALVDTTPTVQCEGGDSSRRSGRCTVDLSSDFRTTFEISGDVTGALESSDLRRIPDPRPQCQVNPQPGSEDLVLYDFEGEDGGYLTIPAYLCGIPNADGQPEIAIIDVEGDLTVTNSIIFHEAENPTDNRDYACRDRYNRDQVPGDFSESTQPVFGWLPKSGEIPVLDGSGRAVNVIEDLTSDCGSYRGGTGRMSYMVYNLHHVEGADLQAITASDVEQLKVTLEQAQACMADPDPVKAAVEPLIAEIEQGVETGDYNTAYDLLLDFGALLDPPAGRAFPEALPPSLEGKSVASRVDDCFYNATASPPIERGPSTRPPRNFRGDMLSQVEHIRYMLVTMLGAEEKIDINLNFATDSSDLPEGSAGLIEVAVDFVRRHPEARFLVVGHTDAQGEEEYNDELSLKRAEALRGALIAAGVEASRIDVRGDGERSPVAANDSEAGRASNRRVEVSLLD